MGLYRTKLKLTAMDKIKRRFKVKYDLDHWEDGVEIRKLKEDIEAIEKLGATHVEIDHGVSYDCSYMTITPVSERIETDDEYNERVRCAKKKQDELKQIELKRLEEIKLKYGL